MMCSLPLLLAALVVLSHPSLAQDQNLNSARVGNGPDLAAALSAQVGTILIQVPELRIVDSDFDGLVTPLIIRSNVTLHGDIMPGVWPLLILVAKQKVTLAPGVTLQFRDIVVDAPQADSPLRSPNLELLTLSSPGGRARILLGPHAGLIVAGCFPPSLQAQNPIERSPNVPGKQISVSPAAQPGCVNDSSAPANLRCWPQAGDFFDVAMSGRRPDVGGTPQPTHYDWVLQDARVLCRAVVPMDCILKLEPAACMLITVRNSTGLLASLLAPSLPRAAVAAATTPAPHKRNTLLAIVLGSVLGGVAFLLAVVGGTLIVRRHRKRVSMYLDSSNSSNLHVGIARHDAMEGGTKSAALLTGKTSATTQAASSTCTGSTDLSQLIITQHTPPHPGINLGVQLSPRPSTRRTGSSSVIAAAACVGSTQSTLNSRDSGTCGLCGHEAEDGQSTDSPRRLTLLPVARGAGACGRVVEGLYGGQRVAVKLLHCGLLSAAVGQQQPKAQHAPESSLQQQQHQPSPPVPMEGPSREVVSGSANWEVNAGASQPTQPQDNTVLGTSSYTPGLLCPAGRSSREDPALRTQAKRQGSATGSRNGNTRLLQTFAQELEVLARLRHPNIIRLLAANLAPPSPCLVLELMDTSLDKLLYGGGTEQRSGPLPLSKVLHIALQVAQALAYLHPTILHRDLKPANVLISNPTSATPIVKLADFGLSRLQETVLVTARANVGTAAYMSPECLNPLNCVVTHHADMYGFGIMLYEMLAGVRPWEGTGMVQIAVAVQERRHRPPLGDLPSQRCPRALRALIEACWDHVPERRPAASEAAKEVLLLKQKVEMQAPTSGTENGTFMAVSNPDRMAPMLSVTQLG